MKHPQFSVEHLGIAARDTAALKDWYLKVLEAIQVFDNGKTPPAFLIQLPGGTTLELYPCTSSVRETGENLVAGWRHLAVRVEAIEPARDLLAGRGVEFAEPIKPAGGGGRVLFFRDPEGNLIHLVERPQDSALRNL
jgi:catechol 2,3-dioxygenase-like lactoylglutathione lyase family enzyme